MYIKRDWIVIIKKKEEGNFILLFFLLLEECGPSPFNEKKGIENTHTHTRTVWRVAIDWKWRRGDTARNIWFIGRRRRCRRGGGGDWNFKKSNVNRASGTTKRQKQMRMFDYLQEKTKRNNKVNLEKAKAKAKKREKKKAFVFCFCFFFLLLFEAHESHRLFKFVLTPDAAGRPARTIIQFTCSCHQCRNLHSLNLDLIK